MKLAECETLYRYNHLLVQGNTGKREVVHVKPNGEKYSVMAPPHSATLYS